MQSLTIESRSAYLRNVGMRSLGVTGWKRGVPRDTEDISLGAKTFGVIAEAGMPATFDVVQEEYSNPPRDFTLRPTLTGFVSDIAILSGSALAGLFVAASTKNVEAGIAVGSAAKVVFNAATHVMADRFHRLHR